MTSEFSMDFPDRVERYRQATLRFNSSPAYLAEMELIWKEGDFTPSDRVLDAGGGAGRWADWLRGRGIPCVAADVMPYAPVVCDLETDLRPLEALAPFTKVTFLHSIGHFRDPARVLRNVLGLCTPDVRLFFSTPNRWFIRLHEIRHWIRHLRPQPPNWSEVVRYFTPRSLSELLREADLDVHRRYCFGRWGIERIFAAATRRRP